MAQYRLEVKGEDIKGFKKTIDKEVTARRLYGKEVKKVAEESGYVRLYQRENVKDEWVLIQEFEQEPE